MRSPSIKKFEFFRDVLVYIAVSPNPVTALELEENVVDLSRGQLNVDLLALEQAGYLFSKSRKHKKFYTATDKTNQLFGLVQKAGTKDGSHMDQKFKTCGWDLARGEDYSVKIQRGEYE
ncbi:hypothetical protein KTH93_11630 [Acinetobacter bereziniae]|uniref:hypothetical protein n=1 Tax=Acinetobacter bereziniae TaxID=106648 RepID=UPI0021D06634|nr:hypothetical protein [Acinetobacter bereziniae]MCU4436119.1 hypothetical protein [Acinetobacter bereziniae]